MHDKHVLDNVKLTLKGLTLLYVEDNKGLQKNAKKFFGNFFEHVYTAFDAKEGIELFKVHKADIVITDIKMPNMTGLEMISHLQEIKPDVKIIIVSAFDNKEYLIEAIRLGVVCYLEKPLAIHKLLETLERVGNIISQDTHQKVFYSHLYNIFNHQENMIIMLKNSKVVLVNDDVLSFFGLNHRSEFAKKFENFNEMLQPHESFLYAKTPHDNCLNTLIKHEGKLFNTKVLSHDSSAHHLIMKVTTIPSRLEYKLLFINDITSLNLLALFDKNAADHDKKLKDSKTVYNLLQAVCKSQGEIKLQNYYKGLPIVNSGIIKKVEGSRVTIKTVFMQQKAIELDNNVILNSALFPYDISSRVVMDVDFDKQEVVISECVMMPTSPTARQHMILDVDDKHTITLFYDGRKFDTSMSVLNISVDSARISMQVLPAGFSTSDNITIDMVFTQERKPIIVNTKASVYKIVELKKSFEVVLLLEPDAGVHKKLIQYLSARQMRLIREFKGLRHGK